MVVRWCCLALALPSSLGITKEPRLVIVVKRLDLLLAPPQDPALCPFRYCPFRSYAMPTQYNLNQKPNDLY